MKNILTMLLILCLGITSMSAQSDQEHVKRKYLKKEFVQSLSADQKKQLGFQKKLKKEHKKKMKATFTEAQLTIANDENLSKRDKKKSLLETFSDEQKKMRKSHKAVLKEEKEKFKKMLTEEQLTKYEGIHKKKPKKKKAHKKEK